MFAGKKSAQIREILINESAWEEMTCLFAPSLAAAKNAGDTASIPTIEAILNEEKQMADWLIQNIPQTTEKFLIRSETDGVEAKK
ncbi:hypothetical protein MUTS8_24300 [Escherichia coli]|nr:hypothetical protein MUTS8_24300 [Escherichia coli]